MSASQRHPEVLANTISAVSGYWTNSQFKKGEAYANVTVSDNLNSNGDIRSFMDYLCTPGDDLRSVTSMGSWSVNAEVSNVEPDESPKTQPSTSPPPKPNLSESKVKEESKNVTPRPSIKPQRRDRRRFGRTFTGGGRSSRGRTGSQEVSENQAGLSAGNRGRTFFSGINELRRNIIL